MLGESPVADKITHLLDNKNPTVATYAKEDGVRIRVTAAAKEKKEALTLINPVIEEIKQLLGGRHRRNLRNPVNKAYSRVYPAIFMPI